MPIAFSITACRSTVPSSVSPITRLPCPEVLNCGSFTQGRRRLYRIRARRWGDRERARQEHVATNGGARARTLPRYLPGFSAGPFRRVAVRRPERAVSRPVAGDRDLSQ